MDEFEVKDSDAIRAILDAYFGSRRGTGGDAARRDEEYYEDLPNELQWLIEDQEVFGNLVDQYLNGEITYEELQEFQIGDYGDYGSRFIDTYNQTMAEIQSQLEEGRSQQTLNDMLSDLENGEYVYGDAGNAYRNGEITKNNSMSL